MRRKGDEGARAGGARRARPQQPAARAESSSSVGGGVVSYAGTARREGHAPAARRARRAREIRGGHEGGFAGRAAALQPPASAAPKERKCSSRRSSTRAGKEATSGYANAATRARPRRVVHWWRLRSMHRAGWQQGAAERAAQACRRPKRAQRPVCLHPATRPPRPSRAACATREKWCRVEAGFCRASRPQGRPLSRAAPRLPAAPPPLLRAAGAPRWRQTKKRNAG